MEDLAVARVPDAGLVLLRAGDGRVPVVHVDGGVGARRTRRRWSGDPHPGHDRARRPVVALDLVVEAAGRAAPRTSARPRPGRGCRSPAARDEAAVRRRPEGVVLDGDEDREVGQGESVAIGDPGVVDRHHGPLGEGSRRPRLWRQQGEQSHHPSHGRAPQAPPRVRHAPPPSTPPEPRGLYRRPGGVRAPADTAPTTLLLHAPRQRSAPEGGPAGPRAKLDRVWLKWPSDNNSAFGAGLRP